jgi:hypothetical protein
MTLRRRKGDREVKSYSLSVIPVSVMFAFAAGSASAEDSAVNTGDSASYFLERAVESENPWGTPKGPPGGESPLVLWQGPNDSYIRATFKAELAYFDQNDSWFGESEANLGLESKDWYESSIRPGLDAHYFTEKSGEIYGRLSALTTSTQDIDAAGSTVPDQDAAHTAMEDAYVGWRSGDMFGSKDFIDVSFGRQQYIAGTGFLFYGESSNGGDRAAYWLGPRKSADYAGIVRINGRRLKTDFVYFKANDNPSSDTKVSGVTLDYGLGADVGSVGGGYYSIDSDITTRDSMDVWDVRTSLTPFKAFGGPSFLEPLTIDGEYVYEDNGDILSAAGWYVSGTYGWENAPWSPSITYRYASFEGDDPNSSKSEDFDPLFYGFSDWGYWFQGEILGEYVLANSNLLSSMVRVSGNPSDTMHVNVFYYHFELDDAGSFGVASDTFADEYNVTLDWTPTDFLSFSLVAAYVKPDDGAKEYTGGNNDWAYGMLYVSYAFK